MRHVNTSDTLGALVVDGCSSPRHSAAIVTQLLADNDGCLATPWIDARRMSNVTIDGDQILAFASYVHSPVQQAVLGAVAADAARAHITHAGDIFSTVSAVPGADVYARALIALLSTYRWHWVSVVVSNNNQQSAQLFAHFDRLVQQSRDLCIAEVLDVQQATRADRKMASNVVIMFTTYEHTEAVQAVLLKSAIKVIVEEYAQIDVQKVGTNSIFTNYECLQPTYPNTIKMYTRYQRRADFEEWLRLLTADKVSEPWYREYVERHFNCAYASSTSTSCRNSGVAFKLSDFTNIGRVTQWIESVCTSVCL
jgi:hypothetical protein